MISSFDARDASGATKKKDKHYSVSATTVTEGYSAWEALIATFSSGECTNGKLADESPEVRRLPTKVHTILNVTFLGYRNRKLEHPLPGIMH